MPKCLLLLICWAALLSAADPAFSIRIRTDLPGDSAANQFTLPLHTGSIYDCTVEWGDGSSLIVTSDVSPTHTYPAPGTYTLRITERSMGGFPRIDCYAKDEATKITALVNWGDVHWSSMAGAFFGCTNMVITATDHATARTGTVSDFAMAWTNCSGLTSFPLIDTHAATSLNNTWSYCSGLTDFPAIDASSVSDFTAAWFNCTRLQSFPQIDTRSGTTFLIAWGNCESLRTFPAIDTHLATSLNAAWHGCTSLRSFPVIDTSNCTNFTDAWGYCASLTSFPSLDTSAGIHFSAAWAGCTNLQSFPLLDTSSGIDFQATWMDCAGLTQFPAFDTAHGTAFDQTWSGCRNLLAFPQLNMRNMSSGMNCFAGVRLPGDIYSALLTDLAAYNTNTTLVFSGGLSCYDSSAVAARNTTLITGRSWMIDDGGPETPPIITSATTASARTGAAFAFTVTTAPRARVYAATGLPAGITLNTATGELTGTPTESGEFLVHLAASNTAGSDEADLLLMVRTNSSDDRNGVLGIGSSCGAGMTASLLLAIGLTLRRRRS